MNKLILLFLFPLVIIFAEDEYNGVYLDASRKHSKNSSVIIDDLPDARNFEEIIFNFDLVFKDRLKYGNIFHLFLGKDKILSIVFSSYKEDGKDGFIISSPDYSFFEIIHVDKNKILNKTSSVSLSLKSNELTFSINNKKISNKISIKHEELNPSKIIFGATSVKPEVTDFILKRFSILYKSKTETDSLLWTFKKFNDNISYDQNKNVKAELKNYATPLVDRHFYWKEKGNIILPPTKANLTFDEKNSILYSISDNTLSIYSYLNDSLKIINLKKNLPFSEGGIITDNFNNRLLYFYKGLESEVSYYDFERNEWSEIDTSIYGTNFYNSIRFISPVDSMLYSIGGYGHFMFKNTLQRYNPKKKIWEQVLTSGDVITPGTNTAQISAKDSIIFIGGGAGSRTGDQRIEVKNLSNVYSVNLRNFKVDYLGEMYPIEDEKQMGITVVLYRKEENSVYFFVKSVDDADFYSIQLYKYDLALRKRTPIGDALINTEYSLSGVYYSAKTDEIVVLVNKRQGIEKVEYKFYSMKIPAVTKAVHDQYIEVSSNNKYFVILVPVFIAIILIAFVRIRKKKITAVAREEKVILKNIIKLFDEFQIYDNEGNNIALNFSSKTMEAFLLILIKSFKLNTHISNGGITSVDFANTLWPDFDKDSQKIIEMLLSIKSGVY